MRCLFLFVLMLGWLLPAAGARAQEGEQAVVLKLADRLMQQRKYESAFILLDSYDPQHQRSAVALKLADLALHYATRHRGYRRFSFHNVLPTETLDSLRLRAASDSLRYAFAVGPVLERLAQQHPSNYKLNKGLGDYYYEVQQCGCAEPERTEDSLFPLMVQHYEKAHENGYGDYLSYYAVGYAHMRLGHFKASATAFEHALSLRKSYALAHFNLAYDYIELHQLPKAIEQAQLAVEFFKEPQFKSDAQYMLENLQRRMAKLQAEAAAKVSAADSTKVATAPKPKTTSAAKRRATKPVPRLATKPQPEALPDSLPQTPLASPPTEAAPASEVPAPAPPTPVAPDTLRPAIQP